MLYYIFPELQAATPLVWEYEDASRKNKRNSQAGLKDQQAALGHHGTQVRVVNKESQKLGDDLSDIEDPLALLGAITPGTATAWLKAFFAWHPKQCDLGEAAGGLCGYRNWG